MRVSDKIVSIGPARIVLLVASMILGVIAIPLAQPEAVAQKVGAAGDGPLIVYRLDPITNRRALPDCFPDVPGTAGGELRLSGCRDEYESASFAVYARQDVQNLRLETGDLRSGKDTLPNSCFESYVVKCWYQAGRDVSKILRVQPWS